MTAALTFSGAHWAWGAIAAAVVLIPLAWFALRPGTARRGAIAVGLALRTAGVGLLLWCILDPHWTEPRPKAGANLVAVVADNSRGLQVSDAGASTSRGAALQELLQSESWSHGLDEQYQLRRYVFDAGLRRVTDFASLDFTGGRSDLGEALQQLRQRFAQQPLAAVVLLTDGNATDLPQGLGETGGLPPVFPVVVGASDGLRDLLVERVEVRQTAFDDAPVTVRTEVAALGGAVPATVSIDTLSAEGAVPPPQTVRWRSGDERRATTEFSWSPSGSGLQFFRVGIRASETSTRLEATELNNARTIVVDRGRATHRILYVGGRPNWEFKFLNRALAEDPQLDLVGLLRLALREPKFQFKGRTGETSNPFFRGFDGTVDDTMRYDQPVLTRLNTRDASELRDGFPRTPEELFAYDAVILDDIEAGFFRPEQLLLLRRFVSERGGGLLTLGGVQSFEHGQYGNTALAAALPIYLDRPRAATPEGPLHWSLTREGWLAPWARIRAEETNERRRLEEMPPFLIANAFAAAKPGATVLATFTDETGEEYPGLVAQPFGRGRSASIALGDLWRWGQKGPAEQADLARFWRQLARWLVTDTPARVELFAAPPGTGGGRELRVTAREADFRPLEFATVKIEIERIDTDDGLPGGVRRGTVLAEPDPEVAGRYLARWDARQAGAYRATAEVRDRSGTVIGRTQAGWIDDSDVEEFRSLVPNRPLLEELARRTGGAMLEFDDLAGLADRLAHTPAPIMELRSRPMWHNPWIYLAILGCFVAEWGWRRWRGLP